MMQVGSNPALARELLGADVTEDNFIERMTAIKERKKRALADLRYRALKGKPLKQSEVKQMMRNLVKNHMVHLEKDRLLSASVHPISTQPVIMSTPSKNIGRLKRLLKAFSSLLYPGSVLPLLLSVGGVFDVLILCTHFKQQWILWFHTVRWCFNILQILLIAFPTQLSLTDHGPLDVSGKYISGASVVVVDKIPDDEIVDPRVKVETIPDSAASPPRRIEGKSLFLLKELLPHVYREDLLLLRRRMNRYFRLNPDVDVGLDLWRDVNLLCQSLHSDDVEDFWSTQMTGWLTVYTLIIRDIVVAGGNVIQKISKLCLHCTTNGFQLTMAHSQARVWLTIANGFGVVKYKSVDGFTRVHQKPGVSVDCVDAAKYFASVVTQSLMFISVIDFSCSPGDSSSSIPAVNVLLTVQVVISADYVSFDPVDCHDYPSRGYHIISCYLFVRAVCEGAIYRIEVCTEVCAGVIYPNKVVLEPGYDKQRQKTYRLMDSGASFHATYCKEEIKRFKLHSRKVCLADDKMLDIAGIGDVSSKLLLLDERKLKFGLRVSTVERWFREAEESFFHIVSEDKETAQKMVLETPLQFGVAERLSSVHSEQGGRRGKGTSLAHLKLNELANTEESGGGVVSRTLQEPLSENVDSYKDGSSFKNPLRARWELRYDMEHPARREALRLHRYEDPPESQALEEPDVVLSQYYHAYTRNASQISMVFKVKEKSEMAGKIKDRCSEKQVLGYVLIVGVTTTVEWESRLQKSITMILIFVEDSWNEELCRDVHQVGDEEKLKLCASSIGLQVN
ncbi:hypothetical protein Tco_0368929 [Tanacetum coccineum]